ncbi:hypothetical protein LYZ84_19695 [Xanthomonas hortorum pv. pelargonii]|uniref:Uncharacterized protein n=1 Tax=Xanthomonas hortorum pv. pelargonii TaxID=453602 RepID=A0A6V7FFR0_9XANT|nr:MULTISPECIES: hypothetical protein [Xanthomonas]MCE4356160.1 hypothetical protein [Xanthomonas hortorum pv. pelargonii]MCU1710779.1 hypothetical protein [Xanthomonas hortorum pv. pelargonii]MDO0860412.1 hypothetical protein [Xanthomonas campestris pv. campestris]MEB2035422.1 hypothetical protein [Xanthomonas campestris pv. campestris]NMI24093.1 hypothetical protein [Xanthomonas hortorum pv. pelargonii]
MSVDAHSENVDAIDRIHDIAHRAGSLITLLIAFYCQTKRDSELSDRALVGVMTQLQDDLVRIEALAKAADSS